MDRSTPTPPGTPGTPSATGTPGTSTPGTGTPAVTAGPTSSGGTPTPSDGLEIILVEYSTDISYWNSEGQSSATMTCEKTSQTTVACDFSDHIYQTAPSFNAPNFHVHIGSNSTDYQAYYALLVADFPGNALHPGLPWAGEWYYDTFSMPVSGYFNTSTGYYFHWFHLANSSPAGDYYMTGHFYVGLREPPTVEPSATPTPTPTATAPASCYNPVDDGILPPYYVDGGCQTLSPGWSIDLPSISWLPNGWTLPATFDVPGIKVCVRYLVIAGTLFGTNIENLIVVATFLVAVVLVVNEIRS